MKIILVLAVMSLFALPTMPGRAQQIAVGEAVLVPLPAGLPPYGHFPDGHISYLRDGAQMQMYWAGDTTYRTRGKNFFQMKDLQPVLGSGEKGTFDGDGAWIYSVFRQSKTDLIGFYHAENRRFKDDPSSNFIAWKSIALALSNDNGKTWRKMGPILTSGKPKPDKPAWGGNGDFCVVRDEKNQRWICYYQEGVLCMAISRDPQGRPGTWRKYFNAPFASSGFTEPGLGGRNSAIPGLENYSGGNPSVHFNTYLKKWVMVWHTWDSASPSPASFWLATSDDMLHWKNPRLLLVPPDNLRIWYPTILGESSDLRADKKAWLCYARFARSEQSRREFIARPIEFYRDE
jgi:hypothetical protein